MAAKKQKPDCPYCGAPMRPAVMVCDRCEVEIRSRFVVTQFQRFSSEDLQFLERYLLAGFSIKALAEESGLGYVAIRNRLDRIIEFYRRIHEREEAKRSILEKVEQGEISAQAAAEEIENL